MLSARKHNHTALALTLVTMLGCARTQAPAAPPAMVGAWRSNVQFEEGAFAAVKDLQFLYVFNAGGTMTESSNYDGMPPVPPAYGEWRSTGTNQFEARYTFFTTNPPKDLPSLATGGGWSPAGSGVLTERIQLATDGKSYDSKIALEMFDAAGRPAPGGAQASAHGVRTGF